MSRAVSDPKLNLTAPLQDALSVQGEHRLHQAQQAAANGTPVSNPQSAQTSPLSQQPVQVRVTVPNGASIRPPSAPQGMSPQTPSRLPQIPQQQQVAALLLQQQHIRDKQSQQPAPITNGVSQPSPSQNPAQPQSQVSPSVPSSQPLTNGSNPAPVSSFVPLQINGTNGIASSPPKATPNGTYQQSPSASPLPPSAGIIGPDAGSIVRVSTPLRSNKLPMQMPNGAPMSMNGFQTLPNQSMPPNQHSGFANTNMPANMYNNLQSMKMINQQQMLAQYQQQFQGHLTPHQVQQQQFQQHQQQQQQMQQQQLQQQLHMMQMQHAGGMGNPMQGHYGDVMSQGQHMPMNMQPNQAIYGQNMFPMGMAPGMNNNSALNMTMQNMNLQLGPQNMALRLPPNRMQQQTNNPMRPVNSMGGDYSMGMNNGSSPMMQAMQNMGMGVTTNQQMQAAMGIPRAPSTPLSLRGGGGLMPNGNMMMVRSPSAAMQSPMMRPNSAASMHSNMGMQMQPTSSLPVSLHGSPASMQQPATPHLRQQTVPGL